ncbi:hypothetical protein KXV31_006407 [Aspergillus fumigatus]|nr:hypothetical protein KXX65_000404 [Aspergillus fumigatus]KAH1808882.1 hypothetical protein KXX19_009090 [Aspergillus fumigatus]KAH1854320.1 hypothetical protein KXX54_005468 [Aspergillus fumigatus]KAH1970421.1 hypothetical protein KXV80_000643 [Aspergillus fumigatus]KAH2022023.1 hypothetical protein KXV65_002151 [Aspergillus fumigatus]
MDPEHCTLDACPIQNAYIHYQPTIAGNSVYLALFGIFLFTQLIQSIFFRMWGFAGAMAAGLVLEVAGYTGRILQHGNPFSFDYFLLNYAIFFVSCDVIALILQSAGGALTSAAEDADGRQMGLNVMIAGLVFQVAALTLFIALASEFAICLRRQHLKGEYQVSHSASLRKDDYAAIRRKKTWTLFLFLTPPALCLTNEANNGSPCSCDYHGLYSVHFLSGGAERRL